MSIECHKYRRVCGLTGNLKIVDQDEGIIHGWNGWLVVQPITFSPCLLRPGMVAGLVYMELRFLTITLRVVTPLGRCCFLVFWCFLGPLGPLRVFLFGGSGKMALISFCVLLGSQYWQTHGLLAP